MPWLVLLVVVAAALAYGVADDRTPSTLEDRADALAAEVRCPTCRSESAFESQAASARAVRADIRERLEAGESEGDIRAYLVSRYGQEILLTPSATGASALVWVLPVAALVAASAGLAFAFRRWRRAAEAEPTDDDRALVAEALRREHEEGGGRP